MSDEGKGTNWLFWPSNIIFDESLDQDFIIVGWRHTSQTMTKLYVVAGLLPCDKYTLAGIDSAISTLKNKYVDSTDILNNFQVLQDLSLSLSQVSRVIRYDPCLGFEYYTHSNSISSLQVDDIESESSFKSSYDIFLIEISEANRILQEVFVILHHAEPETNSRFHIPYYNDLDKCNTSSLKTFISLYQFKTVSSPLMETFKLLQRNTSTHRIRQDGKIEYITLKVLCRYKLERNQQLWSHFVDSVLGILCGVIWLRYSKEMTSWISYIAGHFNNTMLRDNIGWLERFPVGFKLNVPLTIVFGRLILLFSTLYQSITHQLWNYATWYDSTFLGYISIMFGFRCLISICHDLARLFTLHITVLNIFFRTIFRFQGSLIHSLWHLFRGKKKNILRQRGDTLEYDFMQLFLGTIMFVICIFLFTTVLVYFIYFCALDMLIHSTIMIPRKCFLFVSSFPFGYFAASLFEPFSVTIQSEVVEDEDANKNNGSILYYNIQRKTLGWLYVTSKGFQKVFL